MQMQGGHVKHMCLEMELQCVVGGRNSIAKMAWRQVF